MEPRETIEDSLAQQLAAREKTNPTVWERYAGIDITLNGQGQFWAEVPGDDDNQGRTVFNYSVVAVRDAIDEVLAGRRKQKRAVAAKALALPVVWMTRGRDGTTLKEGSVTGLHMRTSNVTGLGNSPPDMVYPDTPQVRSLIAQHGEVQDHLLRIAKTLDEASVSARGRSYGSLISEGEYPDVAATFEARYEAKRKAAAELPEHID